jgi:signal transduction histidine kinase
MSPEEVKFLGTLFVIPIFIITFASDMQWTDRIRQVKIALVVAAIFIAAASLLISHFLVKDLQDEERVRMEIWAQALRSLNSADEHTDLTLVLGVLEGNNNIPVVVVNKQGGIDDYRNISDSTNIIGYVSRMKSNGDTIVVGDQLVCYDDSLMLKRLSAWPYVQLGIVLILVVVAIFALLASKKAEQNKVWVGLSKETAHQLGTPISSLMAWVELLKENYPDDDLIPEMDKDVKRLELVAERFSKIGSLPELIDGSLNDVLLYVSSYMDRRTSRKVDISVNLPVDNVVVKMNKALLEWVVDNLCKNAVDAMEGHGKIDLYLFEENNRAVIEVRDNGKGIKKKDLKSVFAPGFTTKKRGWGLGLSLAKRIVEEYHDGLIFVKNSEVGVGTTFRIELKI